jgi:hypothetical protein
VKTFVAVDASAMDHSRGILAIAHHVVTYHRSFFDTLASFVRSRVLHLDPSTDISTRARVRVQALLVLETSKKLKAGRVQLHPT